MATTLPSDASKTNCDAGTDDPKQALLTDLADLIDKFNTLKGALGALAQYDVSAGGLSVSAQGAGTPDILRVASSVTSKTGAYTVVAADRMKLIRVSGTWTLSLTAAATLGDGFICFVRNYGSGTVTIDPNASETINGAATLALLPEQGGILICSGSAWSFLGHLSALPDGTTATTQSASDNSTKVATTAYADTAASPSYESTAQTLAAAVSVSHGLGAQPSAFTLVLRCSTAEYGYSIGDEIVITSRSSNASGTHTVWADSTSLGYSGAYTNIKITNKTSATLQTLTAANWKFVFRAWR